jgi:SAM-dependent MidA family methyltransferase
VIADIVRERGPMTVAAFMDLALYHPQYGYYARAARRTGRAGDFFTSVDVGPLFGELLEIQIAEMAGILNSQFSIVNFDLVEAGAADGRLSADILRAMRRRDPQLLARTRLQLVEASAAARAAQHDVLRDAVDDPFGSSASLPESFDGVLVANELLDAFPVHQVVMREEGLREVYVRTPQGRPEAESLRSRPKDSEAAPATLRQAQGRPEPRRRTSGGGAPRELNNARLEVFEGPPSTPQLAEYLARLGVSLEPGWRVEINLKAVDWMRDAARRLRRGFMILIDYGHEARELYSASHAGGTLTTFTRHTSSGTEAAAAWLRQPGEQDMTAHVDFTSIRAAAEAKGMTTIGFLDQTYFLLGLTPHLVNPVNLVNPNPVNPVNPVNQLKTLIMPGGLGSTMKVLILGKSVGTPALRGCSYRMRVT